MFTTATRLVSFSGVSKVPSGVDSLGNWTIISCSGMILVPTGIATFATAMRFRFFVYACALDK